METELKELFSKASDLIDNGKFSEAKHLLQELHLKDPKNDVVMAVLADVLWKMEELDDAIIYFQKAIEISPNLEAFSLSLFNTLWESDREEDALLEIKRFTQINYCADYVDIVTELSEDEYYNKIIKKIKLNIIDTDESQ